MESRLFHTLAARSSSMDARLAWHGSLRDAAALARLVEAGADVALVPRPSVLPDFVLEAQAASLGLALRTEAPTHEATEDDSTAKALARGFRGFVIAARPPLARDDVGRFVEMSAAQGWPEDAYATCVVEGPLFLRRADVIAGDVVDADEGWWLEVGLRGC